MQEQSEKPIYWDNHEGFRRLLIAGSVSIVIGVFFADKVASTEFMAWMRGWFHIMAWASGLMALAMCFVLYPKQYSIYPDSLMVEWWYYRRKVVPFDQVYEIEARSIMGRANITLWRRGPGYEINYDSISPRQPEIFAQRLEEAVNRQRFYAGRNPIEVQWKGGFKDNNKKQP